MSEAGGGGGVEIAVVEWDAVRMAVCGGMHLRASVRYELKFN